MKTLDNYIVLKETEKALLIKTFVKELDKEMDFWLAKSKINNNNDILEIDNNTWSSKIEELKNPEPQDSIIIYVSKYEDLEKSFKLILKAKLKKIEMTPWFFVPKSILIENGEFDTDNEQKYYFKIPLWYWEKNMKELIDKQLEFYNKDKEENFFLKKDFKLISKIEE